MIILDPLGDQRYSLKPICRAAMETQIWRTDLWTQWGRESGTNGESGRETCTLPYVNSRGEFAASLRELRPQLCDDNLEA